MQSSTSTSNTTHHPLLLLDDLLTSITTTSSNCKHTQNTNDIDGTKDTNNNNIVEDDNYISLAAEAKQDLKVDLWVLFQFFHFDTSYLLRLL